MSVGEKLLFNGLLMLIPIYLLLCKSTKKPSKDIKNIVLIKIVLHPPCESLYCIILKHCCCFSFYVCSDEYLLYWIFHSFLLCFTPIETFKANVKSFKAFLYLRWSCNEHESKWMLLYSISHPVRFQYNV